MDKIDYFTYLLVFVLQLCAYIHGDTTDACTKQINNCACKTANGYINLEPLDKATNGGQPKFSDISDPSYIDVFSYNPCTAYTTDSSCSNVAGCQNHYGDNYPIGTQESAKFDLSSPPSLEYTSTSGGTTRKMTIKLTCDKSTEGTLTASGEDPSSEGDFDFELTTKYACSDIAPVPEGAGGSGGLSGGSILIIIVFVLAFVYLAGGLVYNGAYKKVRGVEMIPNLEFWKALPGLAKDGVIFTWNKVTCKDKNRSKYDEI